MAMPEELGAFAVPRSRVDRTHVTMRDAILRALDPVLFGPPLVQGERARVDFEGRFAATVNQSHAFGAHSGTIALVLALRACGVRQADEVITVGNSDISTIAAITHCGAVPVLCDVTENDFTINVALVDDLITERTAAILPVDLYGHPADVRRLRQISDRFGLKIIEDAALALGTEDYGKPVGAWADATVFSFAPFKPLGSVGNGAVVTTNNDGIADRVRLLGSYGSGGPAFEDADGRQRHVCEGFNVPLDPLQAAILTAKLPFLANWTERRRAIVRMYARGLRGSSARLPSFRPESSPTFRSYVIRVKEQARVYRALRQAGIEAVLHYVPPVFRQPVYGGNLPGAEHLPVTERLTEELVCLPVAPELDDADVHHVIATLRRVLGGGDGSGAK